MRPVFIHPENAREFRLFQSTERDWVTYPRSPFVLRNRVWEASPNSLCEKFPIKGLAGEQIDVPLAVYYFTRNGPSAYRLQYGWAPVGCLVAQRVFQPVHDLVHANHRLWAWRVIAGISRRNGRMYRISGVRHLDQLSRIVRAHKHSSQRLHPVGLTD